MLIKRIHRIVRVFSANTPMTEQNQQMPELADGRRSLAEFGKMCTFPRNGKF
jgi:hypothetical protein